MTLTERGIWLCSALVSGAVLGACAPHPLPMPLSLPPTTRASFLIDVPEPAPSQPQPGHNRLPPCLHATRFAGIVLPGRTDARVLLSPGYVNVERHNDKRFDAMIVRVEVAEGRRILGMGSNIEYRLTPTVDTAGQSLTTWQATDTVRLLLPWPSDANAKWLLFFVTYRAIAHDGTESECAVILRTDTLRFLPVTAP